MKSSGFKNKYSPLSKKSGFKIPPISMLPYNAELIPYNMVWKEKKQKRMRKFREVKGEDENVLQVAEADVQFSKEIRKRDGQCVNCGSTLFLGCSHYFGRAIYATRYDPYNCITLCQECHEIWELEKNGIYKDYMIMWLGVTGFDWLKSRAQDKVTPYEAITEYMKLSRTLKDNNIEY